MKDLTVPDNLVSLISAQLAHYYLILPKEKKNGMYIFYSYRNLSKEIINELELLIGSRVSYTVVDKEILLKALSKYYRLAKDKSNKVYEGNNNEAFIKTIISEANSLESSDIHLEIYKEQARIRFRIDGILIEKYHLKQQTYKELVNIIKIKANLDITEKRLPQDGRFSFDGFDLRVSVLPTLYGEKIVLRILEKDTLNLSLDNLGFNKEEKEIYLEAIKKSQGIVLISGPTGSGKTTTLYATLKLLNSPHKNILTVEDPIEYTLKGINQIQLRENIGLTFSNALKSFLRQDPDIIMLGEIRDVETAKMAIRAALTGHLVLSTIHTNSALGTITRLIDMGVPSFLIAETLNISVAQRLIRKLCNNCKTEVPLNNLDLPNGFEPPYPIGKVAKPVGCSQCHYTGYTGRTAIYELISNSKELSYYIKKEPHLLSQQVVGKYKSLSEKAYDLLASKLTSVDEVYDLLINDFN